MSTLNVSNITDGTTTLATEYVVNGSAKAWVNFNGGSSTINDSLNASSLYDNATGQFLVNFSSSFSNTSYSVTSGQGYQIGNFVTSYDSVAPYSVSAHIFSKYDPVGSTWQDPQYAQAHCMGDLA